MQRLLTRFLIFFSSFFSLLYSAQIQINSGIENEREYSVLNIEHKSPFYCKNLATSKQPKIIYKCEFSYVPMIKPIASRNEFFNILPTIEDDKFVIFIEPIYNSKIIPYFKKAVVPVPRNSKRWIITGFKKQIPFLSNEKANGLKIPMKITFKEPIYIGSLDISATPLMNTRRSQDVAKFLSIRNKLEGGFYHEVVREVDKIINRNEDFLFYPEVLTIKIKALNLMGNEEAAIVDTGLLWVKTYTAHKDMAENMLHLSKAYLDMGVPSEAMYYLDVLIEEYGETIFSQMAKIYKADRSRFIGDSALMINLYEDVFFNSEDINMASLAADRIADYYSQIQKPELAMQYYRKIHKNNIDFFLKDGVDKAMKYAHKFSYRGLEDLAAQIGDMILKTILPNHTRYKEIIIQTARWHANTKNYVSAKKYYEIYMDKFPFDGKVAVIKEEYQKLFLHQTDENRSQYISKLDFLIDDYPDDSIANKAFYAKVKYQFSNKEYKIVQSLLNKFNKLNNDDFPDVPTLSQMYINTMMQHYLNQKQCADAMSLENDFNVSIDASQYETMYFCLVNSFKYEKALNIAEDALNVVLIPYNKIWLERVLHIASKQGKDQKLLATSQEYIALLDALNQKIDNKYSRMILNAYKRKRDDKAYIDYAIGYEQDFPNADNIIDIYANLVHAYTRKKEIRLAQAYTVKLYELQQQQKTSLYSPWIDFNYATQLANEDKNREAIAVLQKVLQIKLSDAKRARGLYMISLYLDKVGMNDLATNVLSRCSNFEGEDRYINLCKEAYKLTQE